MLVAIGPPELIVRDEDFAGDLLVQLRLGNFGAVVILELEVQSLLARGGALQEPLILLEIEATISLQLGRLHELRGWTELRGLDDFLVCDADSTTLVLLVQQDGLHELVEDVVADLFFLIERQRAAHDARERAPAVLPELGKRRETNLLHLATARRCG